MVHIWPFVGKAKMHLGGGSLFEKFLKIEKNLPYLKHILALPTYVPTYVGSNMHR